MDLRVGAKACLSLPTGETARLLAGLEAVEVGVVSVRVALVTVSSEASESSVSEAMRGEDRVRRPAWE